MDWLSLKNKVAETAAAAKQKVSEGVDSLSETAAAAKQMVSENVDVLGKNLGEGFDSIGKGVGESLDSLGKSLGESLDSVKELASLAGVQVSDFSSKVLDNIGDFSRYFSESALWDKIREFGFKAGAKLIYVVLCFFYALDEMAFKDKMWVMGAMGYFILPMDVIPDILPGAGFSDDLAALLAVFAKLKDSFSLHVIESAKNKTIEWFGEIDESELPDVASFSEEDVTDAIKRVGEAKKKIQDTKMKVLETKDNALETKNQVVQAASILKEQVKKGKS